MKKIPITVAVVCFNEEKNIENCLKSLVSQTLKPQRILIIDNGSTDKTINIVKNFQKTHQNIKLLVNPKKGISISRNIAVDKTKTRLLAFIDADCVASVSWLSSLASGYQKYKALDRNVVAVGGSNIPPVNSFWYKTLRLLLDSFWGAGRSIQGRVYRQDREVTHIPCVNILLEKEKVEKVGRFDTSFGSIIEDEDLTVRLGRRGWRFFYLAKTEVIHNLAPHPIVWFKKMFLYGYGRALFIKKYPHLVSLKFIAPFALVILLPALPFFPPLLYSLYLPYLILTAVFASLQGFKNSQYLTILPLFFLYVITHFFYGVGEIYGLVFTPLRFHHR